MIRNGNLTFLVTLFVVVLCAPHAQGIEVYYSMDTSHAISPSDTRITVQFDTSGSVPTLSEFFANHPVLDDTIAVDSLGRGFLVFGIDPAFGYDTAFAELTADTLVNRCPSVYVVLADSSEFKVTDKVTL